MKSSRWPAIAVLALVLAAPALGQVKNYRDLKYPALRPFTIPEPERSVLRNGMVVMLLEDHELPVIQASLIIRTGSRHEPAGEGGLGGIFGGGLRTGGGPSTDRG